MILEHQNRYCITNSKDVSENETQTPGLKYLPTNQFFEKYLPNISKNKITLQWVHYVPVLLK